MIRRAVLLASLFLQACGGGNSARSGSDRAVAFQADAAHSGVSTVVAPVFPPAAAWSRAYAGFLSYPLIADRRVFIMEAPALGNGFVSRLHALDLASGAVAWGPTDLPSQRFGGGLAFDDGHVFVTTVDGEVMSFDAATGSLSWRITLPDSSLNVNAPTASDGLLYVVEGGVSRVFAIDGARGAIVWTKDVEGLFLATPSVTLNGVYVSSDCQYYRLAARTGAEEWRQDGNGCMGPLGSIVPVANGRAFFRDFMISAPYNAYIDVLDASTGARLKRYTPPILGGQEPIAAVTATGAYLLDRGAMRRFDSSLSTLQWTFAGDGALATPPLVIGGAVVVGSSSGMLYAVDGETGASIWSALLPVAFGELNDFGSGAPSGFAAAEGHLVVPAGNTLTAFRLSP
ncbi:MAG: PQQ-binding-like beta-propeller repeat protein [Caldimonas sp.]